MKRKSIQLSVAMIAALRFYACIEMDVELTDIVVTTPTLGINNALLRRNLIVRNANGTGFELTDFGRSEAAVIFGEYADHLAERSDVQRAITLLREMNQPETPRARFTWLAEQLIELVTHLDEYQRAEVTAIAYVERLATPAIDR